MKNQSSAGNTLTELYITLLIILLESGVGHKKLPAISKEEVKAGFGNNNVEVYDNSDELIQELKSIDWKNKNLLLMTSGNFNGLNLDKFGQELI